MRLIKGAVLVTPYPRGLHILFAIIGFVLPLAGEWVYAWLAMSVTFLVAAAGVVGLGFWVLRGDARNRAAEEAVESDTADH